MRACRLVHPDHADGVTHVVGVVFEWDIYTPRKWRTWCGLRMSDAVVHDGAVPEWKALVVDDPPSCMVCLSEESA